MSKTISATLISDTHGIILPENLKGGDFLLHAGDICPDKYCWGSLKDNVIHEQTKWLDTTFREWSSRQSKIYKRMVFCAGNHDWVFEQYLNDWYKYQDRGEKISVVMEIIDSLPIRFLFNESAMLDGIRLWGSPMSPTFGNWAFMASEEHLDLMYEINVPEKVDIFINHSPCYGINDMAPSYSRNNDKWINVGSKSVLKHVERVKPKLFLAGHLHSGYGIKQVGDTMHVNAALVNEEYNPVHEPINIDLGI